MLILTNGLTDVVDEGFLKVANSLVKRIKEKCPDATVLSYERQSALSDCYLELNKLLLNRKLIKMLRQHKEKLLYVPFPAKTFATALRIFLLSVYSGKKIDAVLVMKSRFGFLARLLLRMSRARLTVLSKDAERFYKAFIKGSRIRYVKCAVDTQKFKPVGAETVVSLKEKYGFDPAIPLVLHVGHLKQGRNVGVLSEIDKKFNVLLVTSTLTKGEQESGLRDKLDNAPNVKIFDNYIPNIEEIYQMADVYLFPTVEECNCIDVPLSCMEAAACGKPVVTTAYGEMSEFKDVSGFYFIESFAPEELNLLIENALAEGAPHSGAAVKDYDWGGAVLQLLTE